ncbi:hypothetical protein P8610_06295 [Fictibacillus sp. UD]|uniref:hypothetical protein n=1 Tax=Fictibacillus sp. UD TaxID=3038777 RepID=UPI003746EFC4
MRRIAVVCSVIILVLLLVSNWFYPFSSISLNKTLVYNADNIIVDDYQKELKQFKKDYESETSTTKNDPTFNRMPFILSVYEQPWLLSKGDTAISKDSLDRMLAEVRESREIILLLAFEENYNISTKSYLKMLLDQTLSLEEEIQTVQQSNMNTRKTLDRQFRNLHVHYISNF